MFFTYAFWIILEYVFFKLTLWCYRLLHFPHKQSTIRITIPWNHHYRNAFCWWAKATYESASLTLTNWQKNAMLSRINKKNIAPECTFHHHLRSARTALNYNFVFMNHQSCLQPNAPSSYIAQLACAAHAICQHARMQSVKDSRT